MFSSSDSYSKPTQGYRFYVPSHSNTCTAQPHSNANPTSLPTKREVYSDEHDHLFNDGEETVIPEEDDRDLESFFGSDDDEPASSLPTRQEPAPVPAPVPAPTLQESEVRPYASVDFFYALTCIINNGIVHEDFVKRLRHPDSIQMLQLLKHRNDQRRKTMQAAVRRQDHSVTVYIPDWVTPYIENIVKGRQDNELLFAGIGLGKANNQKLISLLKEALVKAGSYNTERIGTHSGRKSCTMKTLEVTNGDMRTTAQLIGHANITTTSAYVGRENQHLRGVVQGVSAHWESLVAGQSNDEGHKKVRLSSRQNQVVPTSAVQEVQFGQGVNNGRRAFTDLEIKYMLLEAWTDHQPHIMHLLRAWVAVAVCSGLRISELGRIQVQDVRAPDGSIYYSVLVKWTKGGLMWHQEELLGREAPRHREQRAEETASRILEEGRVPDMHKLKQAALISPDALIREGWAQGDITRPGTGAKVVPIKTLMKTDMMEEFQKFREWKRMSEQDSSVDEDFGRPGKKAKTEPLTTAKNSTPLAHSNTAFTTPQQRDIRSFATPQQDEKKEHSGIDERFSRLPGTDDRIDSIHATVLDPAIADQRLFKTPYSNLEHYAILDGYYNSLSTNDWAGILRDYKEYFHPTRSSTSIKDKIRNMKLAFMSKDQQRAMRDHYANMPDVREGINNIDILRANKIKMSNEEFMHAKWTARREYM